MWTIRCQNCDAVFQVAAQSQGKVAFVGCSNMFKVQYDTEVTCVHCHLDLVLEGPEDGMLGIPKDKPFNTFEKTTFSMRAPIGTTSVTKSKSTPTVKVKIGEMNQTSSSVQEPTTVKPFKILSQNQKPSVRNFRAHINPRPQQNTSSSGKLMLAFAILVGLTLSGFWVFAAVQKSSTVSDLSSFGQSEASESLEETEHDIIEPYMGGLTEDVVIDEEGISNQTMSASAIPEAPEILNLPKTEAITSGFGIRLDPFSHRLAFHGGVDFKTRKGDKVFASLDGTVIFAGRKGKYGNLIRIKHPGGYETRYAHLSKIRVQKGQRVKKGHWIGAAGSTGRSTGPHLHFELLKNSKRLDPLSSKLDLQIKK